MRDSPQKKRGVQVGESVPAGSSTPPLFVYPAGSMSSRESSCNEDRQRLIQPDKTYLRPARPQSSFTGYRDLVIPKHLSKNDSRDSGEENIPLV